MAIIRVNAGRNEESDTIRAVNRAQDGDTISVPNDKCADIVKRMSSRLIFVTIRSKE